MERLTKRSDDGKGYIHCHWMESAEAVDKGQNRLADIEDILGYNYDLSRLRELVQADREGRCVVLPVKPGNTVWSANVFGVSSHVIRRIELNQDGDFACSMLMFPFEDFGNKVFLTREAAEAALKEREKDEP